MTGVPYTYRAIVHHPKFLWPGNAEVAVWVIPNIEHYRYGEPGATVNGVVAPPPDAMNQGWRDYGPRVGVWRIFDTLERLGVRASATLNSEVCDEYPQLVEEGNRLGWEWIAHGLSNSVKMSDLDESDERNAIKGSIDRITRAGGGIAPRGWLGPALAESERTIDLLTESGITYLCDWVADDLPFWLNAKGGRLLSLPYSMEMNDMELILRQRLTGPEYCRRLIDQFDRLYADGRVQGRGRVMAIPLHPFVMGHAHRIGYLEEALQHIVSSRGAWLATGREIVDYYLNEVDCPHAT